MALFFPHLLVIHEVIMIHRRPQFIDTQQTDLTHSDLVYHTLYLNPEVELLSTLAHREEDHCQPLPTLSLPIH